MTWTQKIQPDLSTTSDAGMCLDFVETCFNTPAPFTYQFGCARDSWDGSSFKHADNAIPGNYVPIFFSWVGTIDGVTKDWGHAALYCAGRVLSSPGKGHGQQWFNDINEVERFFGATFLGWTEDISGWRVLDWEPDAEPIVPSPEPMPEPTPVPTPEVKTYTVVENDTLWDISAALLGDPTRWPEIYSLNKDVIGENPDLIHPGQILVLP
jgi:LysM repeat protein